MQFDLIVTRHAGLVEWLRGKLGDAIDGVPVVAHASKEDVRGKHVLGVLPLSLAMHAASVTEISMNLPVHLRGIDLTPAQMDECGATIGEPLAVMSYDYLRFLESRVAGVQF